MLHSKFDYTFGDGDGVLGDQLLECDQKAALQCDPSAGGRESVFESGKRCYAIIRDTYDLVTFPVIAYQAM